GRGAGDGRREVAVRDTGVGIAPEHLARVTEPLYSTKARGLGLGLSIARSILEKNHGSLRVASEPGRGSTFTVLLQAAVPRPPAAQAQGMHPLGPPGGRGGGGGGGGADDTEGKGAP